MVKSNATIRQGHQQAHIFMKGAGYYTGQQQTDIPEKQAHSDLDSTICKSLSGWTGFTR